MSTLALDRPTTPDRAASAVAAARMRLLEAPVGLVELSREQSAASFSPAFRVALPYRGLIIWHVGHDDVVADANQVLFVTGGESYRISEPLPGGYGDLIITPPPALLAELAQVPESRLSEHPLFRRRSRRADPHLQYLRTRLLHRPRAAVDGEDLAAEELVLALLRSALGEEAPSVAPSDATRRLLRQTKELLEAELATPLRLGEVARAVGASPAYLTDLFRRVEGVSLHRYVTQLRLARALVELPHAEDLAALALALGFSSHSHFAAAFRRAFGCTPSQFRQTARGHIRPALP